MAQDDYYYEIQLTNKQLVFYFMAGATGLILSFLAGVMVGRGVDPAASEAQAARTVHEDKVVPEESSPKPAASPADMTYPKLDKDKVEETLESPPPAGAKGKDAKPGQEARASAPPAAPKAEPKPEPRGKEAKAKPTEGKPAEPKPPEAKGSEPKAAEAKLPEAKPEPKPGVEPKPKESKPEPKPAEPKPAEPKPKESKPAAPKPGTFSIQVGAFKDRPTADSVVERLKAKGYAAHVLPPEGNEGLFTVRVGQYPARADAEHVQLKLRDEEKFKPFIVKN